MAPFASGLCLSVSWSFRDAPATLGALSLAAGVAALRALGRLGFARLSLKWPNDILCGDAKLGGILIDLRGEAAGPAYVVVGIGINVRLPQAARERLAAEGAKSRTSPRSAASRHATNSPPCSSPSLRKRSSSSARADSQPSSEEWQAADALAGRAVRVLHGGEPLEGLARGVDGDGALLLEIGGARRRILSGEVSVRPVQ